MAEQMAPFPPVDTVAGLLAAAAKRYEDRPCVRWRAPAGETSVGFRRFYRDSAAAANALRKKLPPNSHVALIGKTSYAYLVMLNGVMAADLVAVPLGAELPVGELSALLRDSDANALFFDDSLPDPAAVLRDAPGVRNVFTRADAEALTAYGADDAPPAERPETPAAIFYTSGTTGGRKGAVLTSGAIVSNVCFREMSFEGGHVALSVLPMHHIFSFSCDYLKNVKDGVTLCLSAGPAALSEELRYYEPTVLRLVPMMADSLLRRTRLLRRRDPSLPPRAAAEAVFGKRISNIIVSGAAYAAETDAEFAEMGITVRQGYGMTETGPRIAVPDGGTCAASGGRIISICRVRLQNGEIQVKSPSLMSGYYKRPEETRLMFTEDGWFRTGDIGRITPENELFITGRLKNVIILSNGENVSPEEIENAYAKEPDVKEIEVFEQNGKIAAEVVPDPALLSDLGPEETLKRLRALVERKNAEAPAMREIDEVFLRTAPLPRTETGKLKRRSAAEKR